VARRARDRPRRLKTDLSVGQARRDAAVLWRPPGHRIRVDHGVPRAQLEQVERGGSHGVFVVNKGRRSEDRAPDAEACRFHVRLGGVGPRGDDFGGGVPVGRPVMSRMRASSSSK